MSKRSNQYILVLPIIFILVALLVCSLGIVSQNATQAFAEEDGESYVVFYSETDVEFAKVKVEDGCFTVPDDVPIAEGKEFIGWSAKGQMGYLSRGNTYSASGVEAVYAVWSAPTEAEAMPVVDDGWNPDPTLLALIIIAIIVFAVLIFVMVYCGALKHRITDLFKRKKK